MAQRCATDRAAPAPRPSTASGGRPASPAADSCRQPWWVKALSSLHAPSRHTAEIKLLDDVVAAQLVDVGRDHDLAVDDNIAAVGDAHRLIEILFGHQDRKIEALA